jgi:histidinol phosphatase-like enzyme (inositol monophosphatase family)
MSYSRELQALLGATRMAGEKALEYWRTGITADAKPDESPVTAADRECERLLVHELCAHFPEDGILGEEGAEKRSESGRRWILDPIDGTRDFVRGNRLWCVMAALEDGGEVTVGVVHFPALGDTYHAVLGAGAYRNGERMRVSSITEVARAVVCVNGLNQLQKFGFSRRLLEWTRGFWAVRSMGGAQDSMLVASGSAEAWIEPVAQPWDLAPLKVITEEAGGRFFNFDGGNSIYAGDCVTCVPALETTMRRFVAA